MELQALHHVPCYANALLQVASQFKLLEMIGPEVTPEVDKARTGIGNTKATKANS